jgi:GT2 family glycosyltransferase
VDPAALRKMSEPGIVRVPCPGSFNFSRICNEAVQKGAAGEYVLLLNNDIEVLTPEWIEELLFYAERPDVGAAGAMLLYPNRTIQHAGVVLGFRGTADHVLRGVSPEDDGYAGSLACAREVSAVTGACLLVRRSLYGLNEHYLVAYQDVDFCLRLRKQGLRNIFVPRARLIHHESYSRSSDYNQVDRALLIDCWHEEIANDPYFNPNFSRGAVDYQLAPNADLGR